MTRISTYRRALSHQSASEFRRRHILDSVAEERTAVGKTSDCSASVLTSTGYRYLSVAVGIVFVGLNHGRI